LFGRTRALGKVGSYAAGFVGVVMVGVWSLIGTTVMDASASMQPLQSTMANAGLARAAVWAADGPRHAEARLPDLQAESELGVLPASEVEAEAAKESATDKKIGSRQQSRRVYLWRRAADGTRFDPDLGF
jgi:hypothetical protein